MSLLRRTAHSLSPHARPSLPATAAATRRAIGVIHPATAGLRTPRTPSPCAGRRNFSVVSALGETVTMTSDALSWAHGTAGMPWYVAIPLLAVGVNVVFRFPLQLYNARLQEGRKQLQPLVTAWTRRHVHQMRYDNLHLPDRIRTLRVLSAVEKSRKRILKTWGLQRWKSMAPLLGTVPFVTVSEALRRKAGAPVGWISNSIGLGNADSVTSASNMFDESLMNGGCLWFTDLTVADPFFGLPCICTIILIWSIWARMPKEQLRALVLPQSGENTVPLTRIQQVLGRTMLAVPMLPLLFADLPSAIFLYWGTSFALTRVNEFFIQRLIRSEALSLKTTQPKNISLPFVLGSKKKRS
ncbi:hypothetical protein FSARC_904 [Fusarium sarcochroum]|uniref:Uncharacterized protein n=1 Tax=Fusarium sarcochroum TaxID=1208366 RepID=A0A8H4XEV8_9HYPO|nr:hypothetical protein FSARC_904 [Fusarium sarcochroum]